MRPIKSITSMVFADKDYGYLVAVCQDNSVWTRVFPEARGDTWREIEPIPDVEAIAIRNIIDKQKEAAE